jgi:hypothetical protein
MKRFFDPSGLSLLTLRLIRFWSFHNYPQKVTAPHPELSPTFFVGILKVSE